MFAKNFSQKIMSRFAILLNLFTRENKRRILAGLVAELRAKVFLELWVAIFHQQTEHLKLFTEVT